LEYPVIKEEGALMISERHGAQGYFNRVSDKWRKLYAASNSLSLHMNRFLRSAVYERYRLVFEHCGPIKDASVLDIGCGAGMHATEFAARGASRVVGIDFALAMVEQARQVAGETGLDNRCEFICDDFLATSFQEEFDIVLAMGLFDYISDPRPIFEKVAGLTKRRFMGSFPMNGPLWRLQRTIRYNWIKGCPVYEYNAEQVESLYKNAMFSHVGILPLKRGLFGIGDR
jgi:2-polyprenyl-3-methyl-5-hydroxy-6-metoxy-1,4-benzoquinol methylase